MGFFGHKYHPKTIVENMCVCGSKADEKIFLVLTVCLVGVVEAVFLGML